MRGSERKARGRKQERPAPIVGIEAAHDRMSEALARRGDRFSQLLSRAVRDERQGSVLMTTSGLTCDEHEELAQLTPGAHENFGVELTAAIARLRDLLTAGDPFYILAVVQDLNLFVPWGEYYEPTHEGLETRLELVAGLLVTQRVAVTRDRPKAETVQAILDEIDHALLVNTLFNLADCATTSRTGSASPTALDERRTSVLPGAPDAPDCERPNQARLDVVSVVGTASVRASSMASSSVSVAPAACSRAQSSSPSASIA